MALDRNAATSERLRRNAQRFRTSSAIGVTVPLKNSGTTISLNLDANGGLITAASALKILLNGTTLLLGASGLSINANGVGSAQLGVLTTKGDILGFSTVHARVPIGSNTQVLTADSAQTLGLKWATPPIFVDAETPGGTIDGVNVTFTLANAPTPASSLYLYKNGLRLILTTDYSLSGSTITFVVAPPGGSVLRADYRR